MVSKSRIACIAAGLAVAASLAPAVASAGSLSADYKFEDSFKSAVNGASALSPEGPSRICPPCEEFDRVKVKGKKQGVWRWPEGDGLRLGNAEKLFGDGGKTYTISMLVNLDTVSGYRKMVDFADFEEDYGWYVYSESLYPYDLGDFDYSKEKVQAGEWRQIVFTRDGSGFARGFVDGKQIGKDRDPNKEVALHGNKLHFLIDDGAGENTGGMIARLRIWENALDPDRIKDLGD